MGEYLAAPALLDEPAVQQSFLSYFNTIVVSPGDGACLSWSVMRALLLIDASVRARAPLLPCAAFPLGKIGLYQKRGGCLECIP